MAEQDVNVGINASTNFPSVAQKVVRSINSLENNLQDLVGVLEDMIKASGDAGSSLDKVSKSSKTVAKDVANSASAVDELRKALELTGKEADQALKSLDFSKINLKSLSADEIGQLAEKLREAGTNLGDFLSTGRIDLSFRPAIEELNELQKLLGEPISIAADFSSTEQAFAELRRLNDGLRQSINETYDALTDDSLNRRLARSFEPVQQLKKTIDEIQGGASVSPLKDLFDFADTRNESQRLIASVETIQNKLREIGPAAKEGNQAAVQEFVDLQRQISAAENSAVSLQQKLRDSQAQFASATSGRNTSLDQLGFRQIKLDDIFPTAEQQKIVQIQSKIDQAVRDSVQEGAVRQTLNFFLAQDRQIASVDRNVVSLTSHLPRLRYALYDVSNTAAIFGGTIVGAITATVKFAADYERAFADVIRTTEITGDEIGTLRRDLINLSKDIPVSFADLADIATLAGQLNIAKENVAEFTETVAQFSATTDVTIESAATSFGRLDQLVDGVNGQFIKLGSSILKVGINAVATESDIIAISTQIASVANIAGFSAAELIGFSSALASVGTRPELARGTFTRLFTEIQQAVAAGDEQLDLFARTAGQSSEEFASAWGAGSGADQVVAVLRGLNQAGNQADGVLRQLGITSVRDVPTLLKLAQSVEEVEKQIAIATLGFDEGTELQKQYGIITETLSEQLAILKNNFASVVAALGSISGPLSFAVKLLSSLLGIIEQIVQTRIGSFVAGTAALFATLLGVAALATSALARFGASGVGAATAMIELREVVAFTKIQVDSLGAATNSETVARLRNIAVSKTQVAQMRAQSVAFARATVAVDASNVSTIRKNLSLGVLQARLSATTASLSAYIARVRLAGAAALVAAQQTRAYSLAITALKGVAGTAVFLGIAFAIEEVTKRFADLNKEAQTAEERFENWGSVLEAVKQDSRDFANATEENIGQFTVLGQSVAGTGEEVSNYSRLVAAATDNEDSLAKVLGNTSDAFDAQTIAIGKNTRAVIAQKLAKELSAATDPSFSDEFFASSVESIRQIFSLGFAPESETNKLVISSKAALNDLIQTLGTDLGAALAQSGFDLGEWTRLVADGSADAANALASRLKPAAEDALGALQREGKGASEEAKTLERIIAADLVGTLNKFVESGSEVQTLLRQTQIELSVTGALFQDFEDGVDGASVATDSFTNALNEIVDAYFAPINAQREMEESVRALGEVFFNEGAQIAVTSREMQDAITAIIATASSPEEAANAMGGFFQSIVDGGYASGEQLATLQGIIIDTYRTAVAAQMETLKQAELSIKASIALARISSRGGGGRARADQLARNQEDQAALNDSLRIIQNINSANGNAAESAGLLAQGYDNARIAADGTGRAAKETAKETKKAAEETRTLLDYASDLQKIYSRAFDIRFGPGQAIDDLAEAWDRFGQNVEDARIKVEELQEAQQNLGADRAIKQYFLSVAEAYNDQLRAAKLREELSELDKKEARDRRDLLEAQAIAGGDVTGQGPGQRQNRNTLLGLVKNYQDYITVLAQSGATQAELTAATEKARREFTEQARELGFHERDIQTYAEAFDDVRVAIDSIPRNITVEANVNPALQALNELNASLRTQIDTANDLNRALNQPVAQRSVVSGDSAAKAALQAQIARQKSVIGAHSSDRGMYARGGQLAAWQNTANRLQAELRALEQKLASGNYAQGGFTGRGGKFDPAGIVHKGEYVIPKQYVNQSTGMPDPSFLAQMQSGMRNYFMGGFVGGGGGTDGGTMMVELSPFDRKLLADAGNVQLRLNGRVVAEATNQNNFDEARRGSN
jgi:TP901 family phage tail tape measure protein